MDKEKLTPAEWAARRGLVGIAPASPFGDPVDDPAYRAAEALHGWAVDAHNYQADADKLRLSEDDFDAALRSAMAGGAAHGPACGRGFEGRAKAPISLRMQRAEERAAAKHRAAPAKLTKPSGKELIDG